MTTPAKGPTIKRPQSVTIEQFPCLTSSPCPLLEPSSHLHALIVQNDGHQLAQSKERPVALRKLQLRVCALLWDTSLVS